MSPIIPKAKILVVDDQPANIQILAEALQVEYDVRIANSGTKALEISREGIKPDLILLDVMMPILDGFEVCRRLKSDVATWDIPVIFITAKNNATDEELGLNIGAVDYVSKPFSIPVVRARVRNHLRLKKHADLLEELASIDSLTHLPNRRHYEARLDDEWKRAQRDGSSLAILMIDIDYFKNYNDHYGHGAGDLCLQRVAQILKSEQARPSDMVARYGGEEFIVILPNTDTEGAKVAGERLRERVEALQIPHAYSPAGPVVSISVGCAAGQPARNTIDAIELIDTADKQLYQAKEQGRNRIM